MDFTRIQNVIDIPRVRAAEVTAVGAGGSATLLCDLARSGVERFRIIDPDRIERSNIARQGHAAAALGSFKVDAVATLIRRINPAAEIVCLPRDFTEFSDQEIAEQFVNTDLFLFTTDRFAAQAFGNTVALRLGKPALWIGLYASGRAGEVVFWHPEMKPCFRCLCASRYLAHERAEALGRSLDPVSDGATIFDVQLLDSIAGMLAIGLLTRGSPNRFGRLIDQLGDRSFLQLKIDPTYTWNGRDLFREQLGIPENCDAYFSFCSIARRDPTGGEPACPDCVAYRGRDAQLEIEPVPAAA